LFFTDPLPAVQAERLGLINRAVPRSRLWEVVDEWSDRVAQSATIALGLTKALVNHSWGQDRAAAFREEAASVELNSRASDCAEGLAAYRERRSTNFTGH